ncbi:unnamed protein product [Urochloa decumbens]|uniref:Protein XRI1 n=1 Tax=Urochloa decumbens TaxID=240449 RepID=A0ABC8V7Q8_9POAL
MTSHLTRPRLSPELHCQQHAMALDSYSAYDCCVLPPLDWDWDWDELHTTLGLGGAGGAAVVQEPAFFFPATPGVESPASSEASSGYLQDAVAHWSGRCSNKRQRMAETPPPRRPAAVSEDLQCLLEGFWDSSAEGGGGGDGGGDLLPHGGLNTTIPEPEPEPEPEICCSFVSGEDGAGALCREMGLSAQVLPAPAAQRGGEEAAAARAAALVVPSPPPRFPATVRAAAPLQKATAWEDHAAARRDDRSRPVVVGCCECELPSRAGVAATTAPGSACPSLLAGEEKRGVGVLYPFAVVKPLGLGDGRMTTLDDVNQRNLKRPARPVRHPVGQFACGPAVTAHGLGLSGKAVVSLTKIRTGEKGTITIIRTRG